MLVTSLIQGDSILIIMPLLAPNLEMNSCTGTTRRSLLFISRSDRQILWYFTPGREQKNKKNNYTDFLNRDLRIFLYLDACSESQKAGEREIMKDCHIFTSP